MQSLKLIGCVLFSFPALLFAGQEDGFESIFDGSLKDWEGDPTYWRAENGTLIGEVKPETLLKKNSFIIWRGGELADFELKLEYRVSAQGNSGINYRSIEVPDPETKFAMMGYQADIDGQDQWSGQNYEERGRTFLAYRGESVVLKPEQKPELVKTLGDRAELQKSVKKEEWNEVHLIVRGNHFQHFINGVLMSEVKDEDAEKRKAAGLLGVQVHVGPPMKIEFREIRVKRLGSESLAALGAVTKVTYTLSANGEPVRPEGIEALRKAYQAFCTAALDLDPTTRAEKYEALSSSLVATRNLEFKVGQSLSNLKPGDIVHVAERCLLEEAMGMSNYSIGNDQAGLIRSEQYVAGISTAIACWSVQAIQIQSAR